MDREKKKNKIKNVAGFFIHDFSILKMRFGEQKLACSTTYGEREKKIKDKNFVSFLIHLFSLLKMRFSEQEIACS